MNLLRIQSTPFKIILAGLLLFAGCTKDKESKAVVETTKKGEVNLAIWSNYINQDFIEEFTKKTGIKVNVANYSSNEELLGKLQAGGALYDLAVPSDYMVFIMGKLGLLVELDRQQLKAFATLDEKLLGKGFDPSNKFSVPYGWGTTGIAYNKDLFKGTVTGWKDLLDNPAIKGQFSLLDDARETIGAALKADGKSINSVRPDELKKAKDLLLRARKNAKAFSSDPYNLLVAGEVAVAHAYSSDSLKARDATKGKIQFVIPKEGGTLWIDNLVIPAGAKNKSEAYALINFLLEPRVNSSRTTVFFSAPVVKESVALLPKSLQTDVSLFPPAEVLKKLEMMIDLGEKNNELDRIWTELKAAGD